MIPTVTAVSPCFILLNFFRIFLQLLNNFYFYLIFLDFCYIFSSILLLSNYYQLTIVTNTRTIILFCCLLSVFFSCTSVHSTKTTIRSGLYHIFSILSNFLFLSFFALKFTNTIQLLTITKHFSEFSKQPQLTSQSF